MRAARDLAPAILLLLSACASSGSGLGAWRASDFGWHYKQDSGVGLADGPLALYGPPETLASHIFGCDPGARVLEFADLEVEPYRGSRPISIEALGVRWSGRETLDPPDAVTVSRSSIPLDHPLLDALERGASPIRIRTGACFSIPNHPILARVIRECRAAAAR